MGVRAIRYFGPDPDPRQMEGAASIRLYPESRRRVRREPQRSPRVAQTTGGQTAREMCDATDHA
jgi:hypothetical protein